jgi:hypothetical protein
MEEGTMDMQNTRDLQEFVVCHEISDKESKDIEMMIKAFSEYLVAVNPDYVYNKTYLGAFVEDFVLCQRALKLKYQILSEKIITQLEKIGIESDCSIRIDGAWKYENGKLKLSNLINPYYVKKNKMQVEMEFIHDNGFVIAEEIDIAEEYDEKLETCISEFVSRRKEVLGDEI